MTRAYTTRSRYVLSLMMKGWISWTRTCKKGLIRAVVCITSWKPPMIISPAMGESITLKITGSKFSYCGRIKYWLSKNESHGWALPQPPKQMSGLGRIFVILKAIDKNLWLRYKYIWPVWTLPEAVLAPTPRTHTYCYVEIVGDPMRSLICSIPGPLQNLCNDI